MGRVLAALRLRRLSSSPATKMFKLLAILLLLVAVTTAKPLDDIESGSGSEGGPPEGSGCDESEPAEGGPENGDGEPEPENGDEEPEPENGDKEPEPENG